MIVIRLTNCAKVMDAITRTSYHSETWMDLKLTGEETNHDPGISVGII